MKLQAYNNIFFLFFIFIYQLLGKWDYTVIVDGIKVSNSTLQMTTESVRWSVLFYCALSLYIVLMNLNLHRFTILPIHKKVNLATALFFAYYFITESLCFVFSDKYYNFVVHANIFISGMMAIIALFIVLTYKSIKQ